MTLEVIGAGFGRTGTMSLKNALEMLGVGPCYHMIEETRHPHHDLIWQDATDRKPVDWDALFTGYRSAVDWPAAAFWPELSAHFPKAKIILTTRDPEAWYQSISRTIFPTLLNEPGSEEEENPAHRHMTHSLIIERVFKQKVNDRDFVLDVYQRNSLAVIRDIEPARLLQYQPGDGWKPLCDFLGVSVPEEPYPHVNNTAEFRKWVALD